MKLTFSKSGKYFIYKAMFSSRDMIRNVFVNPPYQNSLTLDARVGCWTLDAGLWIMGSGYWTLDSRQWTLDAGFWTLDSKCWTLDAGLWTLDVDIVFDCCRTESEPSS